MIPIASTLYALSPQITQSALALGALYLAQNFPSIESKKTPKLEISDNDKFQSYNFFLKTRGYFASYAKSGFELGQVNFHPTEKSKVDFLKRFGMEYKDQSAKISNPFQNSPLIEYVAQHDLNLYKILDNCDFKSNPQITKNALTYQDANGLNFLNHATRNRGALGNKLTAKIVDIYVDNLDKETLLKSLDKFVLTLPPEQFKKIADKIGIENLQKISEKGIAKKTIKSEISKYHSPDIFPRMANKEYPDLDGYHQTTIIRQSTNPQEVKSLIGNGLSVQIDEETRAQMFKSSEKIPSNVYVNKGASLSGVVATKATFNKLTEDQKINFKATFDITQTVLENSLKNLENNRKFLAQQKTSFSSLKIENKEPTKSPLKPSIQSSREISKPSEL